MTAGILVEIDGATLIIPAETAREVVPLGDLTPVPGAPPAVHGLTEIKGQPVPVVEASAFSPFTPAPRLRVPGDPLVLVEAEGMRVALAVDRVLPPGTRSRRSGALGGASDRARTFDAARFLTALRDAVATAAGGASAVAAPLPPPPGADRPDSERFSPPAPTLGSSLSAADLHMLRGFFLDEATSHLDAMDLALVSLAETPTSDSARALLLRELHTLKGAAGSVALGELSLLAHRVEDRVLSLGGRAPSPVEVAALGSAVEHLRAQTARATRPVKQNGQIGAPEVDGSSELHPTTAGTSDTSAGTSNTPAGSSVRRDLRTNLFADTPRIRVEVERVHALMEAVGELVVDRSRMVRRLQELEHASRELLHVRAAIEEGRHDATRLDRATTLLDNIFDRIEAATGALLGETDGLRHTAQVLQEGLQGMRTMEVGLLFARLAAPMSDLARRAGREIEVHTIGVKTAVDKAVVERIADPLLHLLRNAVAHGIEPPEHRVRLGKPRAGRVELLARQRGAQILIEVADDGAGIDVAGVRQALVRTGRLNETQAALLDEPQILAAIFEPGISTREGADDLAGRGVGLDAVHESIARLGGTIACASTPGRGTRFTVRLPLDTAIGRALLFKVGGQVYGVPAQNVVESGRIPRTAHHSGPRGELLVRKGRRLPLLVLGTLLGAGGDPVQVPPTGAPSDPLPAFILDDEGERFAVLCDKLIGERDIVILGLGPLWPLPLYAGATLSGAGKVQLLLDVTELRRRAVSQPTDAAAAAESSLGPRVLVVDDSLTTRESVCRMLRLAGYRVDEAADGQAAWALFARRTYDVVVTDLEMPILDGYALLACIRKEPALAGLPVVVMSSQGAAAGRRAVAEGATAFVGKTSTPHALVDAVARALAPALLTPPGIA